MRVKGTQSEPHPASKKKKRGGVNASSKRLSTMMGCFEFGLSSEMRRARSSESRQTLEHRRKTGPRGLTGDSRVGGAARDSVVGDRVEDTCPAKKRRGNAHATRTSQTGWGKMGHSGYISLVVCTLALASRTQAKRRWRSETYAYLSMSTGQLASCQSRRPSPKRGFRRGGRQERKVGDLRIRLPHFWSPEPVPPEARRAGEQH